MIDVGGQKKVVEVGKLSEDELRALVPDLLDRLKQSEQRIAELLRMIYGRRSEKSRYDTATGLLPFDGIDDLREELEAASSEADSITVPAHERKTSKRRSEFPDHLPRHRTEFTLEGAARDCPECGTERAEIGEEVAQELERVEFVYVNQLARKKYACRKCEGHVAIAEGGQRVLPKCVLGPGFLAQIIFERFGNHMPYARLETKYKTEGISIARSVMCTSVMRCAELLEPVFEAHKKQVLESLANSVLQGDDTTITLRNGRDPGSREIFLWAWRDQVAGVFYMLTESRNRDGPMELIGDREGRLQCDGHDCFDGLDLALIVRIGCWAHVRRYFEKANKSGDKNAVRILALINKLFAIERMAKELAVKRTTPLTDGELLVIRKEKSAPIVAAIKAWLDDAVLSPPSLPKGPLMKGVRYTIRQWSTLTRFLEDGRIREISNNGCERALRAPVIGRKNWNFFGSEEGAKAGVIMMSLVQSCREHGINPLLYLRDVLHLISVVPASQVGTLTPRGWKATGAEVERKTRAAGELADVVRALSF